MSERKQKHTGGTWVALAECIWAEFPEGGKESIATTASYFFNETVAIANAARIVRCVNACAGIEDPEKAHRDARAAQSLVQAMRTEVAMWRRGMSAGPSPETILIWAECLNNTLAALTPKQEGTET